MMDRKHIDKILHIMKNNTLRCCFKNLLMEMTRLTCVPGTQSHRNTILI